MFSYPERLLAWRYMRAKRREGFVSVITAFSVIGIMLGVATLILVTSLMNGVRQEMIANFVGLDGHINLYAERGPLTDSRVLMERIGGQLKGRSDLVSTMIERIEGQAMASATGRAMGAQVVGLHGDDLKKKPLLLKNASPHAEENFRAGGVLVGKRLLENLGIGSDGAITLISPQGRATIAGMVPRIKNYPVAGTFSTGMHSLDSSLVILPYEEARIYFALPESPGGVASSIELTLPNADGVPAMVDYLNKLLADHPPLRIYDWQQNNQSVLTALNIQRDVMVVILTLIIVVAAFNIISSLIMLVQDKSREVAILRSMGATRGGVLRIFLLSGMSIGLLGTGLGIVLGLLAATYIDSLRQGLEVMLGQKILVEDIYFLSSLPTKTDPAEVALIIGLALLLSFLSTLYPAWKAASTSPAEALRYD